MKNFNPERAVIVDETAESDELGDFLDKIDSKAKNFRTQIISDAFRELASSAKQERTKLLDAAEKQFSTAAVKDRADIADAITKKIASSIARFEARMEKLIASQSSLDDLVAKIPQPKEAEAFDHKPILDAVKSIRGDLDAIETQRKEDSEVLTTLAEALEKQAKAKAPSKKWSFTFRRDHLGRIDGEVIATRLE